jgi:hypothetical protein
VTAVIDIPVPKKQSGAKRGRKYVPLGTAGLIIKVDTVVNGVETDYSDTGYSLTFPSDTTNGSNCTQEAFNDFYQCKITLNAPATTATSTDAFFLYEYDQPQESGALDPSTYVPSGALLGEGIGSCANPTSGTGEPVPGDTNGGITVNQSTTLTFNINPVVAAPLPRIGSTTTGLVISMPGTGGASDAFQIDGTDADGNVISSYVKGSCDDTFNNPISFSEDQEYENVFSGTVDDQSIVVTYSPVPGTTPSSAGAGPPAATLRVDAALSGGGYNGTSNFTTDEVGVQMAPLFAYTANEGAILLGNTLLFEFQTYAIQFAVPTGESSPGSYSLAMSPGGTGCTAQPEGIEALGTGSGYQQAIFRYFLPLGAMNCPFVLSDGISQVPFTVTAE